MKAARICSSPIQKEEEYDTPKKTCCHQVTYLQYIDKPCDLIKTDRSHLQGNSFTVRPEFCPAVAGSVYFLNLMDILLTANGWATKPLWTATGSSYVSTSWKVIKWHSTGTYWRVTKTKRKTNPQLSGKDSLILKKEPVDFLNACNEMTPSMRKVKLCQYFCHENQTH